MSEQSNLHCLAASGHRLFIALENHLTIGAQDEASVIIDPEHLRLKQVSPKRMRRVHRKLRSGCKQCKGRRVKVIAPIVIHKSSD